MGSLDRSLSLSFGAVVLSLMVVFLLVASLLSFQIQDRRQNFLATALAQSVGESVNRVNPYQMRSLVEELTSHIPGLGYVAVADLSGRLLAHSRPGLSGRTLGEFGLTDGDRDDVVWEGVHYWQRVLPLRGGLEQTASGTIVVGVATDDLRHDQAVFLGTLALLSLAGTLAAVGVILVLSRRFGNRMVAQLDRIIDKSPVGMATVDLATGRVVRLNQQFEATFHWNQSELPDIQSWFNRAYPDDRYRQEVQGDWNKVTSESLSQGTPVPSFVLSVRCGDQKDRAVLVSTAVFERTAVITFVDRTEQVQAENQLKNLNQSLEETIRIRSEELERSYRELADTEKMAALGQQAAGMAHELNTPLGAIQSANSLNHEFMNRTLPQAFALIRTFSSEEMAFFDDLLARSSPLAAAVPGLLDRRVRRALGARLGDLGWDADDDLIDYCLELNLSDEALATLAASERRRQIFQLSRDLLVLSRMTLVVSDGVTKAAKVVDALRRYLKGADEEDRGWFSLEEQLETLLTLFHHKLKLGVDVVRGYGTGEPVFGDPHRLNQVWMNLIHNALQAMEFRGTLGLTIVREPGSVVVEVSDNGPGIPEAIQARIFDPYFTTKTNGEGLGLGLDLCRRILHEHQGTITFRSRPGSTVFTVTLPVPQEA